MTHETLDETIDRVASELTAVSADPAFADRVRKRLADRRRPFVMPVLAAASVVGAVGVATVLWPQRETPAPASRELVAKPAAPIVPLPATVSSDSAGPLPGEVEGGTLVQPPHPSAVAAAEAEAQSTGPAPLAIAELTITPMGRPDAVAIAPLDVAPLEVPELDTTYEFKEPR